MFQHHLGFLPLLLQCLHPHRASNQVSRCVSEPRGHQMIGCVKAEAQSRIKVLTWVPNMSFIGSMSPQSQIICTFCAENHFQCEGSHNFLSESQRHSLLAKKKKSLTTDFEHHKDGMDLVHWTGL